jgi:subtilase family serine protease
VEPIETNNDKSSGVIRIGGDLAVVSVSASIPVRAGGPITVTDTTSNQGAAAVSVSTTAFYLSSNTAYDEPDQFLGNRTVAKADGDDGIQESLETNNVRVRTISITPTP